MITVTFRGLKTSYPLTFNSLIDYFKSSIGKWHLERPELFTVNIKRPESDRIVKTYLEKSRMKSYEVRK